MKRKLPSISVYFNQSCESWGNSCDRSKGCDLCLHHVLHQVPLRKSRTAAASGHWRTHAGNTHSFTLLRFHFIIENFSLWPLSLSCWKGKKCFSQRQEEKLNNQLVTKLASRQALFYIWPRLKEIWSNLLFYQDATTKTKTLRFAHVGVNLWPSTSDVWSVFPWAALNLNITIRNCDWKQLNLEGKLL